MNPAQEAMWKEELMAHESGYLTNRLHVSSGRAQPPSLFPGCVNYCKTDGRNFLSEP